MVHRFLNAAGVPIKADAVSGGQVMNPVTANDDVVRAPVYGNATRIPRPVGVINMIKLYGVVRTGRPMPLKPISRTVLRIAVSGLAP